MTRSSRAQGQRSRVQPVMLKEILKAIPTAEQVKGGPIPDETDLLFQQLGKLLGPEALDLIVERYGEANGAFTASAMGAALSGWMKVDPKRASLGLLELAGNAENQVELESRMVFHWNDQIVTIAGDFSPALFHVAMTTPLQLASRYNREAGLEILGSLAQLNFLPPFAAFTSALDSGTDWQGVREQLEEAVGRGWSRQIDQAIAQGWATHDLRSALDWYAQQPSNANRSLENIAPAVLLQVEERSLAIDWMEEQIQAEAISDRFVQDFAAHPLSGMTEEMAHRLANLPRGPETRAQIIEAWVESARAPTASQSNFSSEFLHSLINTTPLPPERRSALYETLSQIRTPE